MSYVEEVPDGGTWLAVTLTPYGEIYLRQREEALREEASKRQK